MGLSNLISKLSCVGTWALLGSFLLSGCGGERLVVNGSEAVSVLYGQTARIVGFDPVATGDLASSRAMQRVYEGFLQYDYTARPYTLIPALAADMPTVSDDGLTYRFELRRGIYFPDDPCFPGGIGRELFAEDVLYSIKRLADMKTLSSGYWTVRGKIEGLDAFREKSAVQADCYEEPIEGLRALDRYTIEFRLSKPYPQFLNVLAMHYFSFIPREAVEFYGDQFSSHPVGTAAYRLKRWKRNYRLEYEVNPAWKKHPRPEPLPAFETIVDYVIADGTTKWLLFSSGQLDIIGLSSEQFESVLMPDGTLPMELAEQGVQLYRTQKLDVFYLGFNMEDEVVGANRALRQALSCAFDHASWARLYEHQVEPLYGPVPQPLPAAKQEAGPYGFNLTKAKQLLAEAGYPDGIDPKTGRRLELVLDSSGADDSQIRQSNELLVGFMAALGIELRVNYSNRPTFFDRVRKGDVQLFRLSWIADYSDEHNFLQLFYGPNAQGCNRANYRNSTYDKLFESFMVLGPCEARDALAEQMVKILVEDCPWIFMHQPVDTVLAGPRVDNYVPHAFPGGMTRHLRRRELKREE